MTVPAEDVTFPDADWADAAPEAEGLDAPRLEAAVRRLGRRLGRPGTERMLVARRGRAVWRGPRADKVQGIWSVTKSVTSTALGLLVADGACTLETRAAEAVPALAEAYPDVTLRHLATMTSGYRAEGDAPKGAYAHGPSETPFAPSPRPLFAPPGSAFAYWDSAMNEMAHVLTRLAGEPLAALVARRVLGPIGIAPEAWTWGDWGPVEGCLVHGGAGNHGKHVRTSAAALARLGHLFLSGGTWAGRQVLPRTWVREATRPQVARDVPLAFDRFDGGGCYGLNWWTNGVRRDGARRWPGAPAGTFAAVGLHNCVCFVVPEWALVAARLGTERDVDEAAWSEFFRDVGGEL